MFIGEYGKFVYLTYFGTAVSLIAIQFIIQGEIIWAMSCFIVSGLCDLFDGMVARSFDRTKAQEQFGIEIDTLCDMVSFAALPAILLLTQGRLPLLNVFLAIIYVLTAVSRLAYFNREAKNNSAERAAYFRGVPVTYGALVFPVSYLVSEWLISGSFQYIILLLAPMMSFLFIRDVKIPKPNRLMYLFFLGLAFITLFGLWRL
ncbi:CDP-alcohol phosphatidyltransferase family protein [Desemzia sp. RIT804]|uniref:CDP-alcohol phosphatidyltransferase family protein n=1 Tax=Desemzia sp. RIT 804 TaxID=2810209 RepID=UPI00194E2B40|nr:CDP-alcohol phosphatidyltransferase family protein [Desemzia sp. RIT 804]MBM6614940.1 CDP-alcohol phosphatidyltransferase family protein [Desemzia sp. RIT 804]